MVCSGYIPRFKKQLDGTTYAGLNCTCASAAMAADYDSCGKIQIYPYQVRRWTGDTSGGTTLAQVDKALNTYESVDLEVYYKLAWTDFVAKINAGRGAILQGWYAPIRDSRFRGSETFGGNHAIFIPPGWGAMDPLADGRRTGIYKYHGEAYPLSLLRDFAGRLNLSTTGYSALGLGLVYAAFTRDNSAAYKFSIHPTPPATSIAYFQYTVVNGVITGRVRKYTGGFSAACTPPKLYNWPGKGNYSLVKITSGAYAGRYLPAQYAKEV